MIETLTAAAISKLVFETAIKTSAGKLSEAGLAKAQQLWQKIRGKVKDEGVTEATLVEVETQETQKSLPIFEEKVVPFFQVAMLKDADFAHQIQHIAQQINQEIRTTSQDIIEQKDFEAHDSSVVAGKIEGQEQYIGGTHTHEKK